MSIVTCSAKLMLFIFNILFLVTGLIVTIIALMVEKLLRDHSTFVGTTWLTPATLIALIGLAIVIISFFGCCGVIKESRVLLLMFSTLLFTVFILELGAGAYGYANSENLQQVIKHNMMNTMAEYRKDNATTEAWDIVQQDFKCCGTNNYTDWKNITTLKDLPHTCCYEAKENCTSDYAYRQGCYDTFAKRLQSKSCQLGTIAIGLSVAQLLSVLVAYYLAKRMNRYYEAV